MNIRRETTAGQQPDDAAIERYVSAVLAHTKKQGEVAICIVDEQASAALNERYRGKSGPTNVLSFPVQAESDLSLDLDAGIATELANELANELGDLVICSAVVEREAEQQAKSLEAHWAHMVVHGVLHLLGFDHVDTSDAEQMEAQEIEILQKMGYPDPY